jgi:hypothetical protein
MPPSSTARRSTSAQKSQSASNGHQAAKTADHRGISMPSVSMPKMPGGTAGNVIWWGGLAAAAAFGVVDWPVAALIAAGTWVADQHSKQAARARAAR